MTASDQKTYKDRLEKLKNLITKEFPSNKFEVKSEPVISISLDRQTKERERNPKIEFSPDYEFMTDSDSNVEEIFQQGIHLAKRILNDPPMKDRIMQGKIQLTHNGAIFSKRKI